jgi:aminoglycoside/choline kinase family phosphotransferase
MPPTTETSIPDLRSIEAFVAEHAQLAGPLEATPLAGGLSPRRFIRVKLAGGESAVVMVVPPETPDRTFALDHGREWPFLELRALLESIGVRVPRLLGAATGLGLLLVEDLGETLAEYLERVPSARSELYTRAVRELANAQAKLDPLPAGSVVKERGFDRALYAAELDHFWDFGWVARGFDTAGRQDFEAARDYLVEALDALPRGFTHRDYQSRNLMVVERGGERSLAWIDFQDALLGPRAYDLVALLADSYQPFDRAFVEARLNEYAEARGIDAADRARLGREFDLITVQRKLKDAGRFVFFERMRGDASYLRFVEPTLAIVRDALSRLTEVAELRALNGLLAKLQR